MLDVDAQPPEGLDHHPRILAVESAGQDARPVGHRGDDQRPVGQALRARARGRPPEAADPSRVRSASLPDSHWSLVVCSCRASILVPRLLVLTEYRDNDLAHTTLEMRFRSSSVSIPRMRNRFCREAAPEISDTCAALQPRFSASTDLDGRVGLPFVRRGRHGDPERPGALAEDGVALRARVGPRPAGSRPRRAERSRSWLDPLEQSRADPDQRRPLLDGRLEIIRHPHRSSSRGKPVRCRRSSRSSRSATNDAARRLRRRPQRGHRHQADDRDRSARRDRFTSASTWSAVQPCLLVSPEVLTCKQTDGRRREGRRRFVEGLQQLERVHRVDHDDHGESFLDLVGLQVSNQVPADGIPEVGQRFRLPPEFLGIVLAQVAGPGRRQAAGSIPVGCAWSRRPGGRPRRHGRTAAPPRRSGSGSSSRFSRIRSSFMIAVVGQLSGLTVGASGRKA